eukprot:8311745-Pyramimonas_sp.AAC.1
MPHRKKDQQKGLNKGSTSGLRAPASRKRRAPHYRTGAFSRRVGKLLFAIRLVGVDTILRLVPTKHVSYRTGPVGRLLIVGQQSPALPDAGELQLLFDLGHLQLLQPGGRG